MRTIGYFAALGVAIWSLSAGWTAARATWEAPTPGGVGAALSYLLAFVAAFLYLGFWIYAADRTAGRVRRPIGLYERFLRGR